MNMIACILILVSGSSDGGKDLGSSIGFVSLARLISNAYYQSPATSQLLVYYRSYCGIGACCLLLDVLASDFHVDQYIMVT